MGTRQHGELPRDLAQARSRFEAWRERRQGGRRIPQPLWNLAVRLASQHGGSRTATALGLDYYSLKKQAEAAAPGTPPCGPAFGGLAPPMRLGQQALFALDNGAGATMRVQLLGYDAADVEALARRFWGAE